MTDPNKTSNETLKFFPRRGMFHVPRATDVIGIGSDPIVVENARQKCSFLCEEIAFDRVQFQPKFAEICYTSRKA